MLTITFRNISHLAEISDYEWAVEVNYTTVDEGVLKGHKRSDGWEALVKLFAKSLEGEDYGKDK